MGTFLLDKEETINILVGKVLFEHKGDRLYADSARLNITKNIVHAYGNVKIEQTDGTTAYADMMYYNGNNKNVELTGNVELSSGADHLWSKKVLYNLTTQIGSYSNNGTLQTGNTIISSKSATYNAKTDYARFKGDVNVLDPAYEVVSADLGYNTVSRVVTFFGPSIINNDSSTLYTTKGTYDAAYEVAHFENRSSIQSGKQYMEADTLDYDRKIGHGIGKGNVFLIDSTQNATLYCELAIINELTKQMMATQEPYLRIIKDSSTMYFKADTFYSGLVRYLSLSQDSNQVLSAQDSLFRALDILQRDASYGKVLDSQLVDKLDSLQLLKEQRRATFDANQRDEVIDFRQPTSDTVIKPIITKDSMDFFIDTSSNAADISLTDSTVDKALFDSIYIPDSIQTLAQQDMDKDMYVDTDEILLPNNPVDTNDLRYFIGYRNVIVYSDSFQARCDSVFYSQKDSIMQMHYNPIVWSRNGQITGTIILAHVDSNNIKWVKIPQNGIIINQSTMANEVMFDQIQGNTIWAYFTNNEMDSILAKGSAQTIYYAKDESDAYVGVSEASSGDVKIIFEADSTNQRQIDKIIYYNSFEQKMTPMEQAKPSLIRLNRFAWRKTEKLPDLEAFFKAVYKDEEKLHKNHVQEALNK